MSGRIRIALAFVVASAAFVGACALPAAARAATPGQTLEQAISDRAQETTIAFSGLALITGNLELSADGKAMKYFEVTDFALQLTPKTLAEAAQTLTLTDPEKGPSRKERS